jgi:DNA adenine methylase
VGFHCSTGTNGRFVLSLNERPEVRQVFRGFRFADVRLTYKVAGGVGSRVDEVIILDNKEPQPAFLPKR